ncbi:hypothetical protein [Glycomyces sp. NRRL B-16210]|uniref:hypothetical protein n=1 Tax=Glycomyces sp. NRRL B-16210 TaxID=1463821 RepID=UPI0004C20A67|nr:hypothetical protein [Glycomyces sp. NRRL B-16210]
MTEEPFAAHNTFNGDNPNVVQAGRIDALHLHNGPEVVVPQEGSPVRTDWIGRDGDLDAIDEALRHGRPVALHGEAGSGTTAVALMAIDRNRGRYPDGQVYIDLDKDEASEAMQSVLIRLGVAPAQIPPSLEGRVAVFRSVTRNRSLLVVVDRITRSREAPLFRPASATAGFLAVTSVALDDQPYLVHDLGPLEPDIAAEYLRCACPNLPDGVAPRLIAEFGARPSDLSKLAGLIRLRSLTGLLEVQDAVDGKSLLETVEASLSESAKWLYRLLAALPNREFERALTGIFTGAKGWGLEAVPAPLAELLDAELVVEHRPGWYRVEHAAEGRFDPRDPVPVEIFSARRDSLTWHVRRAQLADLAVMGDRARFAPDFGRRVRPPGFSGPAEAMEWLRTLYAALSVSVEIAADRLWTDEAWALAEALWAYFSNANRYREAVKCYRSALAVADGPAVEAQLSALLGLSLIGCEEYVEAGQVLDRGLAAAAEARGGPGLGRHARRWTELMGIVAEQLGRLRLRERRLDEADAYTDTAIACAEEIERPRAVGIRLRVRAEILLARGDHLGAEREWRRAAVIFQGEKDDRNLIGTRLDLAMLHFSQLRDAASLAEVDQFVATAIRKGLWQLAAETHERVAEVLVPHSNEDLIARPEERLERALHLYEAHGAPLDADRIRNALGVSEASER